MAFRIEDLTDDRAIQEARASVPTDKIFSDIIDDRGSQYIDLVMEGGGMLGIALVGYTWALEQVGLRFLGVGGTSAGSINALLLAALDKPSAPKSPKLLDIVANMDFLAFVDGGACAKRLVRTISRRSKLPAVALFPALVPRILATLGINPGKAFEKWLTAILRKVGIYTLSDLFARMADVPDTLQLRPDTAHDNKELPTGRLALVAADVSTETKVTFPEMADYYFDNPGSVNPAVFVRASMSIPYFFEPMKISPLPRGPAATEAWKKVGYDCERENGIPEKAVFVDGGIMSNFPIDTFHNSKSVPRMPTFGVKLQYDCRRRDITTPGALFGAIFSSSRHCLDYDFIHRNPDFKHLVHWIPCQGHNWLNFAMDDYEKKALFKEGALCAFDFLKGFKWEKYKEIRRKIHEGYNVQLTRSAFQVSTVLRSHASMPGLI